VQAVIIEQLSVDLHLLYKYYHFIFVVSKYVINYHISNCIHSYQLTPSVPIGLKSSGLHSLHVILHVHISTDDCTRKLFKPSKDLASLHVCNEKKFLVFVFLVSDVTSRVVLSFFGLFIWP